MATARRTPGNHGYRKAIVARNTNEAINSYITDMLALEDHIGKAVKTQLTDLKDYPEILAELRQFHHKVEHHISDLRMLSDRRNAGGVVESVKRAGSAVAGAAAGLIDLLRTEGLPKNLRDDYTAFNLAGSGTSCCTPRPWRSTTRKWRSCRSSTTATTPTRSCGSTCSCPPPSCASSSRTGSPPATTRRNWPAGISRTPGTDVVRLVGGPGTGHRARALSRLANAGQDLISLRP